MDAVPRTLRPQRAPQWPPCLMADLLPDAFYGDAGSGEVSSPPPPPVAPPPLAPPPPPVPDESAFRNEAYMTLVFFGMLGLGFLAVFIQSELKKREARRRQAADAEYLLQVSMSGPEDRPERPETTQSAGYYAPHQDF